MRPPKTIVAVLATGLQAPRSQFPGAHLAESVRVVPCADVSIHHAQGKDYGRETQ